MADWAQPSDVHKIFLKNLLTLEQLGDTSDIEPKIAEAQDYVEASLPFTKAVMDAWAVAPALVTDAVANYAAGLIVEAMEQFDMAEALKANAETLLSGIRSGQLRVFDPNDSDAEITVTANVSAARDSTDRDFTKEKLEDI